MPTLEDSAREIREFFIPDFNEWKDHDKYTKAFDSLLKTLKMPMRPAQRSSAYRFKTGLNL